MKGFSGFKGVLSAFRHKDPDLTGKLRKQRRKRNGPLRINATPEEVARAIFAAAKKPVPVGETKVAE